VAAYDLKARALAQMFRDNFEKLASADPDLAEAGPRL
jgi:ATP-dependent phosphoenolpyruvate carboxykinase